MSADKHFHPPAPVPDALEDHQPDDMPAARSLGVIIVCLLVVCAVIAAIVYGRVNRNVAPTDPAQQEYVR